MLPDITHPARAAFPVSTEVDGRFRAALAREYLQARLERRPACPLHVAATIEQGGGVYAVQEVEIGGFDTMSGKAKTTLIVTAHSSGQAAEFGPCWWKQTRAKTGAVKQTYTSPAGKHGSWTDMVTALVALTAARLAEQGVAA